MGLMTRKCRLLLIYSTQLSTECQLVSMLPHSQTLNSKTGTFDVGAGEIEKGGAVAPLSTISASSMPQSWASLGAGPWFQWPPIVTIVGDLLLDINPRMQI